MLLNHACHNAIDSFFGSTRSLVSYQFRKMLAQVLRLTLLFSDLFCDIARELFWSLVRPSGLLHLEHQDSFCSVFGLRKDRCATKIN